MEGCRIWLCQSWWAVSSVLPGRMGRRLLRGISAPLGWNGAHMGVGELQLEPTWVSTKCEYWSNGTGWETCVQLNGKEQIKRPQRQLRNFPQLQGTRVLWQQPEHMVLNCMAQLMGYHPVLTVNKAANRDMRQRGAYENFLWPRVTRKLLLGGVSWAFSFLIRAHQLQATYPVLQDHGNRYFSRPPYYYITLQWGL